MPARWVREMHAAFTPVSRDESAAAADGPVGYGYLWWVWDGPHGDGRSGARTRRWERSGSTSSCSRRSTSWWRTRRARARTGPVSHPGSTARCSAAQLRAWPAMRRSKGSRVHDRPAAASNSFHRRGIARAASEGRPPSISAARPSADRGGGPPPPGTGLRAASPGKEKGAAASPAVAPWGCFCTSQITALVSSRITGPFSAA